MMSLCGGKTLEFEPGRRLKSSIRMEESTSIKDS